MGGWQAGDYKRRFFRSQLRPAAIPAGPRGGFTDWNQKLYRSQRFCAIYYPNPSMDTQDEWDAPNSGTFVIGSHLASRTVTAELR